MGNKAVTIHIASIGTPLDDGSRSKVGHMWYELHDGNGNSSSYGFAPKEPGQAFGPGKVYETDTEHYLDRKYMRTIRISDDQYKKMTDFANDPSEHGFDKYNGITNSCVDFTWKGLAHAGILPGLRHLSKPEGEILPGDNLDMVESIEGEDVPYPGEIDYMEDKSTLEKIWDKVTARGGSQQSQLMAISKGPSFNYTSYKKDSVAGYTLIQAMDNATDTASHTFFNGQPAYLLAQTTQPTCQGDESGVGGGVRSGTVGKEVKPTSGSSSIFIAGKALVREGDSCTMNNGNVTGTYILA